MVFSLKKLAAATLVMASLTAFTSAAQANITAEQSAAILKSFDGKNLTDFRSFLGSLAKSDLAKTDKLNRPSAPSSTTRP